MFKARRQFRTHSPLQRVAVVVALLATIGTLGNENARAQRVRLGATPATTENNENASATDAARLNVNSENQQLLRRADELVREGRFDLACTIWQRVLDDGAATLLTRDEWQFKTRDGATYRRYRPVAVELQETIAKLPAAGLTIYRASADAEARALLAADDGTRRDAALSEVVRRYFLSSLGDDAALELASRALDRHDFVGAARQLNQLDKLYPDPSVSRGDVLIRLAVASANAGDTKGAQEALERLDKLSTGRPPQRLVDAVAAHVKHPRPAALDASDKLPQLAATYLAKGLSDGWHDILFDLTNAASPTSLPGYPRPSASPMRAVAVPIAADRDAILQRWQQSSRPPAGQLLVQDRLAIYKTSERVVCRDLVTGKLNWLGWENAYQPILPPNIPYYGNMVPMHRPGMRTSIQAGLSADTQLMCDRVQASMNLVGDMVLAIEAQPPKQVGPATVNAQQFYPGGVAWSRQRENQLTAYEATTGKLRWVRAAAEKLGPGQPAAKAGFLAAPVPFGRQLLVPLMENNAIWLASLDGDTGSTKWRTKICDEPDNNFSIWSPVGVTVEGGDVYVATGAGVVAALDAISGSIHWLTLYDRRQRANNPVAGNPAMAMRFGRTVVPNEPAACWQDDVVIARGSRLVVLPSDADEILGLDRGSGQFIWKAARVEGKPPSNDPAKLPQGPDYCLGVLGENLYVAGAKTVRCYKLSGGRLEWTHALTNSCGRGVLTEDAIYVPDNNEVVRLDPRTDPQVTKRELDRTRVVTPSGEPLGNLFTDGRQLLVVGMFRVYSLESLEIRLSRLARRITDGDRQARRDRMRIYFRADRLDEAVEDLVASYRTPGTTPTADDFPWLLEGMEELQLASSRPVRTVELLASARTDLRAAKVTLLPGDQLRRQSALLGTALNAMRKEPPRDLSVYLKAAGTSDEEYLTKQLCKLVNSVATPSDAVELKQALSGDSPSVRRVAAAGLGKIPGDASRETLVGALKDNDLPVRLEVAWQLANRGERAALPVLAEMLKSDEPAIRERAYSTLNQSTGQTHGYQHFGPPGERSTAADAWIKWLADAGAKAELKFPLPETPQGMGRLLVASLATNRVVELDSQGKELWSQQVTGPYGVHGTPDGRRIVANYSGQTVHEFDAQGKEIWKTTNLPGNPTCVQRLANGNTLIVLGNNGQVVEVAPDKRIVQTLQFGPGIAFARRLENGNTLVCMPHQNRVVEFDPSRREVATFPAINPTAARRLENGNTLIAEQRLNRIVEMSPSGQLVWSANDIPGPWDVERLGSGNTIVSSGRGVEELGPDGRVIRTLNYPSVYRLSAF